MYKATGLKAQGKMGVKAEEEYILAGDIGGTKTSLGIFVMGKRRPLMKAFKDYPSRGYNGIEEIIGLFFSKNRYVVKRACFGVAGPVDKGLCKTTNLPWTVNAAKIKKIFSMEDVRLINDLSAMAAAVPYLKTSEIHVINHARPEKNGNISVIAPGTGLGEALLIYSEKGYVAVPSEGGHVDFAPNNDLEAGLLRFLWNRYEHVSLERIISGMGILNIYDYLKSTGKYSEPRWLSSKLRGGDPAKVINEMASERAQRLCLKTIDLFLSILGGAAGNLALTGLTKGGVYLGGGIPPKLIWRIEEDTFMKAFTAKGRFKELMNKIPVSVILNNNAGLLGAAITGFKG